MTITADDTSPGLPMLASDGPVSRLTPTAEALEMYEGLPVPLQAFALAYVAADQYRSLRPFRERFVEMLEIM